MRYVDNPFKNFELKTEKSLTVAEEHRVQLSLDSNYQWGTGWKSNEDMIAFERSVYKALFSDKNYFIEEDEKWGGCPHLKSRKDDNMDLYIHPMELTGYATPEDIRNIQQILSNKCRDVVFGTELTIDEEVYLLSDSDYKAVLHANAGRIRELLEKAYDEGYNPYKSDVGYDFARECRIPRVGDGSGLGLFDTDVQVITDMAEVFKAEKEYELEKQREQQKECLEEPGLEDPEEDYER